MVVVQRHHPPQQLLLQNQQRFRIVGAVIIFSCMVLLMFSTSKRKTAITSLQPPIITTASAVSSTTTSRLSVNGAAVVVTANTISPAQKRRIDAKLRKERLRRNIPRPQEVLIPPPKDKEIPVSSPPCPYESISDLTEEELHPKEGMRHMVTPPQGGTLSLVCCHTTKGPLNIAVHAKWAPNGAQRFLEMVRSDYFNTGVPMMRCIQDFLCQFGLAGSKSKLFRNYIPDDVNWLPSGPNNRENKLGVARFAQGYLTYAGNNPDSRSNQLILALKPSGPLGGGSPWEIPWGELVGTHSFDTAANFYAGYGEGPPQEWLWEADGIEKVKRDFPLLDFINSCHVVDQRFED